MLRHSALPRRLPLLAAALCVAGVAQAQSFSANYDLARGREGGISGVGLSMRAGRNWFGEVALGKTDPLAGTAVTDILSVAGGYRWADGQALSLQLSRGRDQRLGLSLGYDWPRYFVRFTWDSRVNLVPQDTLRLSAGVRF